MSSKNILIIILFLLFPHFAISRTLTWRKGNVTVTIQKKHSSVVDKALEMFSSDMQVLTGKKVKETGSGSLQVFQLDQASNKDMKSLEAMRIPINKIITRRDAYWIGIRNSKVVIVGSNGRGTAYGLLRLVHMDPGMDDSYEMTVIPSVEYRGISIEETPMRGYDFHRLFGIMLRLGANTFSMNLDKNMKGAQFTKSIHAVADSFGIILSAPDGDQGIRLQGHKRESSTVYMAWQDDGYGYVRPIDVTSQQGNTGVVYHLNHAGLPHDYLWLSTTQPGLIATEMINAYNHGARRLWMVALHNPNVAAYPLNLFMDLAWNVDTLRQTGVKGHLKSWLAKNFGDVAADRLTEPLCQYYRLVGIRRPEFMDFSIQSTSTDDNINGDGGINNTEFNAEEFGNELERYLNSYRDICREVKAVSDDIIDDRYKSKFFVYVEYPVRSAALMADKMLEAQESRLIGRPQSFHHDDEALESAARSVRAYWQMQLLNNQYDESVAHLSWNKPIEATPHFLSIFGQPVLTDTVSDDEVEKYYDGEPVYARLSTDGCIVCNACEYKEAVNAIQHNLLGHSLKAVELKQDGTLTYRFRSNAMGGVLRLAFIPAFSPDGESSQCEVSIDGSTPRTVIVNDGSASSDRWAQGVLRGQSIVTLPVSIPYGVHTLTIRALNDHIILDQWMIDRDAERRFYTFPSPW